MKICPAASGEEIKMPLLAARCLLSSSYAYEKHRNVHEKLLSQMKRDDLHLLIRNDNLILLYGAVEMESKDETRYTDIRYSLRCLARLVQEYQKHDMNSRASDLVFCKNFENVLCAAKSLTGYRDSRDIDVLNTFCKYGYCLRTLALVVRGVALKERDEEKKNECRDFLEL